MRFSSAIAVAGAGVASVNAAALQGFNYGATLTTGVPKTQSDFEVDFKKAQELAGTSGWTSARLYTSIQGGSTNDPISAIPAAIATNTKLLLGIWASAGDISNEIAAIEKAVEQYGSKFTDLVVGLSVGSEDLYRVSPTGIKNKSGVGAGPDTLVEYINQVKAKNWGFSIGHVDTWNDWTNSSNSAVIEAIDWLGFDEYPYFESTIANSIDEAEGLFDRSLQATKDVAQGKPVWVTETGWPVSGPNSGDGVASTENAEKYWQAVACKLIGEVNTFWYTLRDAEPSTPSPSFGIIPSDVNSDPLYDLTCSKKSTSSSSASSSQTKTASTATASDSEATSTIVDAGAGGHGPTAVATTLAPVVTGTDSSPASNTTSPSYSAGQPSASTTGAYTGDASSFGGLSSFAAIVAFFGLVAHV